MSRHETLIVAAITLLFLVVMAYIALGVGVLIGVAWGLT